MLSGGSIVAMVGISRFGNASMRFSVPVRWATPRRICMFDAVSFVEIDSQHVELLPARTVMSLLHAGGGDGGKGGAGGSAQGGLGINILSGIGILGTGTASAGDAFGGNGGSADGGRG
jgi:hypothetical protein